jgi:hypothetical protein
MNWLFKGIALCSCGFLLEAKAYPWGSEVSGKKAAVGGVDAVMQVGVGHVHELA